MPARRFPSQFHILTAFLAAVTDVAAVMILFYTSFIPSSVYVVAVGWSTFIVSLDLQYAVMFTVQAIVGTAVGAAMGLGAAALSTVIAGYLNFHISTALLFPCAFILATSHEIVDSPLAGIMRPDTAYIGLYLVGSFSDGLTTESAWMIIASIAIASFIGLGVCILARLFISRWGSRQRLERAIARFSQKSMLLFEGLVVYLMTGPDHYSEMTDRYAELDAAFEDVAIAKRLLDSSPWWKVDKVLIEDLVSCLAIIPSQLLALQHTLDSRYSHEVYKEVWVPLEPTFTELASSVSKTLRPGGERFANSAIPDLCNLLYQELINRVHQQGVKHLKMSGVFEPIPDETQESVAGDNSLAPPSTARDVASVASLTGSVGEDMSEFPDLMRFAFSMLAVLRFARLVNRYGRLKSELTKQPFQLSIRSLINRCGQKVVALFSLREWQKSLLPNPRQDWDTRAHTETVASQPTPEPASQVLDGAPLRSITLQSVDRPGTLETVRVRGYGWFGRLFGNLRFPIKVAVSQQIFVQAMVAWHAASPDGIARNAFWAAVAFIFCSLPTLGGAVAKGSRRIIGTAIGGGLGLVSVLLSQKGDIFTYTLQLFMIAFFGKLLAFLPLVGYAGQCVPMTWALVALANWSQPLTESQTVDFAVDRIILTSLGALAAALLGVLVLPRFAALGYRRATSRLIETCADLSERAVEFVLCERAAVDPKISVGAPEIVAAYHATAAYKSNRNIRKDENARAALKDETNAEIVMIDVVRCFREGPSTVSIGRLVKLKPKIERLQHAAMIVFATAAGSILDPTTFDAVSLQLRGAMTGLSAELLKVKPLLCAVVALPVAVSIPSISLKLKVLNLSARLVELRQQLISDGRYRQALQGGLLRIYAFVFTLEQFSDAWKDLLDSVRAGGIETPSLQDVAV